VIEAFNNICFAGGDTYLSPLAPKGGKGREMSWTEDFIARNTPIEEDEDEYWERVEREAEANDRAWVELIYGKE
jgi:hypothetical protein